MTKQEFSEKYPSYIQFIHRKLIAKNHKDMLYQSEAFEKQYQSDLESVIEDDIRERRPRDASIYSWLKENENSKYLTSLHYGISLIKSALKHFNNPAK